jgi:hypothetical protein
MDTEQPTNLPKALYEARCQLDNWRSQRPSKRTRLPKEFWQKAVALAKEHGLNKTARALNVKYYSLKKHLDEAVADEGGPAKTQPDFVELLPGTVTAGGVECTMEWADRHGATVRMHIRGAGPSELIALTGVLGNGRT